MVWFGESLDPDVLSRVDQELDRCDLCLVVSVGRKSFGKEYVVKDKAAILNIHDTISQF